MSISQNIFCLIASLFVSHSLRREFLHELGMLKVLQHSVFKVPQDGQMLFAELRQLPVRLPPLSLNELPFDEW